MKPGRITLTCCAGVAMAFAVAIPAVAASWAPDAEVLARDGVRVGWPLHQPQTTLRPGTNLTVTVGSAGTSRVSRATDVALLRVTARGVPMRVVARRRLRSGRYTVTLPTGDGRIYALRLTVARHSWQALVTTRAPAAVRTVQPAVMPSQTPVPAAPSPATDNGTSAGSGPTSVEPPGTQWVECTETSGASVTWMLDATTAVAGATVPGRLTVGPTCIDYGATYWWERRNDDGSWTRWPWPSDWFFPDYQDTAYPHMVIDTSVDVPPDATPGHYRVVWPMDVDPKQGPHTDPATGWWLYDLDATAELDVVAPPTP
jgi:hypothetical protein